MPRRLRDLSDTDLDVLNNTTDKYLMQYNGSSGKFDIIPADTIIANTSDDLPDAFVDQLEEQIKVENLDFDGVDAGTF